jgi:PIN domain nuclease of toxin-antitoxin system
MLALVKNEPGADVVAAFLTNPGNRCFAHPVNLCEVYYPIARDAGEERADRLIQGLFDIGVTARRDFDLPFCWEVSRLRACFKAEAMRVSLADCFCLATARRLGAELLTCDHAEFDPVVPMDLCTFTFIR